MFQTGFHYLLSVLTSFSVTIRDFFCAECLEHYEFLPPRPVLPLRPSSPGALRVLFAAETFFDYETFSACGNTSSSVTGFTSSTPIFAFFAAKNFAFSAWSNTSSFFAAETFFNYGTFSAWSNTSSSARVCLWHRHARSTLTPLGGSPT
jgi:hypothetical protein